MSEHTDAARLEATRDAIRTGTAPRPRVETERVRSLAEEHPGHIGLKTIRDLALDLLDARAEVERLTKEKARARQMAFEEGAIWGYTGPTGAAIQAEAELRYPFPTPGAATDAR